MEPGETPHLPPTRGENRRPLLKTFLYVTRLKRTLGHFPVEEIRLDSRAAAPGPQPQCPSETARSPERGRWFRERAPSHPCGQTDSWRSPRSRSADTQFCTPAKAWPGRTDTILITPRASLVRHSRGDILVFGAGQQDATAWRRPRCETNPVQMQAPRAGGKALGVQRLGPGGTHPTEQRRPPCPTLCTNSLQGDGGPGGGHGSHSRRGKPVLLVTRNGATRS